MAEETLKTVISQLRSNQKANTQELEYLQSQITGLTNSFNIMFKELTRSFKALAMDNLESKREAKKTSNKMKAGSGSSSKIEVPALIGIQGLIAGISAITAAVGGLRGWELKPLENLRKMSKVLKLLLFPATLASMVAGAFTFEKFKTFSGYITSKFTDLKIKMIKALGFDVTFARFNDPKSGLKIGLIEQIQNGLNNLRTVLTGRIYQMMGLGVDGKPIIVQDAAGKFKKGELTIVGKLIKNFNMIISPFKFISDGITSFVGGAGKALFSFLKTFGLVASSGAGQVARFGGGIAKLFGKLLWPIGILFSAFDGIKAFIETEGSIFEKTLAGIYSFIGDFIGAPLDLIKSGFIFILKKIGIGVDKDGKIDPNTFTGAVMQFIDDFSFEDTIKAIPRLIMKIIDTVIAFIKDPIGVGKKVFTSIVDGIKFAFFATIRKVFSFIPSSFLPDFLKDPAEKLGDKISSFEKITEKSLKSASKKSDKASKAQTELERIQNMIVTGNYETGRGVTKIKDEKAALREIAKQQAIIDEFQKNVSIARYSAMAFSELQKMEAQRLKQQQDDINQFNNASSGSPIVIGGDNNSTNMTNNSLLDANPTISKDASDNSGLTSGFFDLNRD